MTMYIGGVPAHPLVVHLAAVAIPLAAVMCLVWALRPGRFSPSWRLATVATTTVAAVSLLLARWTGEGLLAPMGLSEENLGDVAQHAQYANASTVATLALFVVAVLLYAVGLPRFSAKAPAWAPAALRALVAVAAVAAIVAAVLVGHAGAQLAWADFPRG
ncbi:hypothetical protein [Corynebacterium senegalense]|uniref:hypothetical protein n=1 Tax=Corynebacterium senegalense TaxID=2080750 RepID=UPI000E200B34|nr:hypothetical protein [Corynebacterium senegalense]